MRSSKQTQGLKAIEVKGEGVEVEVETWHRRSTRSLLFPPRSQGKEVRLCKQHRKGEMRAHAIHATRSQLSPRTHAQHKMTPRRDSGPHRVAASGDPNPGSHAPVFGDKLAR